jgi:hypothetical protein
LPSPDEQKIATPGWALKRAAEIGAEMAESISALGVRVVGDISILGTIPPGTAEAAAGLGALPLPVPAEAAVHAVAGAFSAGGVGGQPAEEILREIEARVMLRMLARRGGQRIRRTLLPRGDDRG